MTKKTNKPGDEVDAVTVQDAVPAEPEKTLKPIKAVRLVRDGVKRCGPYLAGRDYRVPEDVSLEEAHRLIGAKGFIEVEG